MQKDTAQYLAHARGARLSRLAALLVDPERARAHERAVLEWRLALAMTALHALGQIGKQEQREAFSSCLKGADAATLECLAWLTETALRPSLSQQLERNRIAFVHGVLHILSVIEREQLSRCCEPGTAPPRSSSAGR